MMSWSCSASPPQASYLFGYSFFFLARERAAATHALRARVPPPPPPRRAHYDDAVGLRGWCRVLALLQHFPRDPGCQHSAWSISILSGRLRPPRVVPPSGVGITVLGRGFELANGPFTLLASVCSGNGSNKCLRYRPEAENSRVTGGVAS